MLNEIKFWKAVLEDGLHKHAHPYQHITRMFKNIERKAAIA